MGSSAQASFGSGVMRLEEAQVAAPEIIIEPSAFRFDAQEGGGQQSGILKIRLSDGSSFKPTVRKVGGVVAKWLNCKDTSDGFSQAECTANPR